jgi:hypothetical protein
MTNFIAFRFTDNDFHIVLKEAIEYIIENRSEELTLESFREFVLRGMVAFNSLRRIDNWFASQPYKDYRGYFEKILVVKEIEKVQDVGDSFDGYIFDKNTLMVYHFGS